MGRQHAWNEQECLAVACVCQAMQSGLGDHFLSLCWQNTQQEKRLRAAPMRSHQQRLVIARYSCVLFWIHKTHICGTYFPSVRWLFAS